MNQHSELVHTAQTNQNRTDENFQSSVMRIPTDQNSEMKCVETAWLFDTESDAHLMPQRAWSQLNGQDLGALGTLLVRSFLCSITVQFRAVVARGVGRCVLGGTQPRSMGYAFLFARKWALRHAPVLWNEGVDVT